MVEVNNSDKTLYFSAEHITLSNVYNFVSEMKSYKVTKKYSRTELIITVGCFMILTLG